MTFADEFVIPAGFDNWLLNLMCFCLILAAVVHIWHSMRDKPPMDKQVRDLEDRLNAKIDAEIDTVSDWVIGQGYVRKETLDVHLANIEKQGEQRDHATEVFRAELREKFGAIFGAIRDLGDKLSFVDGRTRKESK